MKYLFLIFIITATTSQAQEVLRIQNNGTVHIQDNTELTIKGGITLENGSTLTNNGTITIQQNILAGLADWVDNTVTGYNHGTGIVIFNSAGSQSITSNNIFGTLRIDNAGLNLSSNIRSNYWYLKSGIVTTGVNAAYVLNTTSTAINADPSNTNFINAWINGKLRRYAELAES